MSRYSSLFRRPAALTSTRIPNTNIAHPRQPQFSRALTQTTAGFHAMKKWEALKRKSTVPNLNLPPPIHHKRSFWGFSYHAPAQPNPQSNQRNSNSTPHPFDTANPQTDAAVGKDKLQAKDKQNNEEDGGNQPSKKSDLSSIPRTLPSFLGGGGPFL